MAAAQAALALVEAPGLHSAAAADATRALAELLNWEAGRAAAVCAVANVPGALSRLLDLVRVRIASLVLSNSCNCCAIFNVACWLLQAGWLLLQVLSQENPHGVRT